MTTRLATVTPRVLAAALVLGVRLAGGGPRLARAQDTSRTFNAPADRVFTVTRSVLKSLGWDIDKEDRDVGWFRTDSRRLDGDNFGVYAKGVKHRLRLVINREGTSRTTVTVERRVYKEERIKTDDRSVEKRILDEIGRSL
jgi:hypothetical protein